jgi:hypothetical protein
MDRGNKSVGTWSGLLVLTASGIALELLQMRLLSFMLWHHLAYMVISMVLLGLGAGGVWLSLRAERILARAELWLTLSTGLAGVTTVAAFAVLARLHLDTFQLSGSQVATLALHYAVLLVPYLLVGLALGILFTRGIARIGRLYFVDLLGSASGAVVFHLLIQPVGAPRALVLASAGVSLAGLLFALDTPSRRLRLLGGLLFTLTAAAIPWSDPLIPTRPAATKALALMSRQRGARIVYSRWTPISRIDVLESEEMSNPFAPGHWPGSLVKAVTIDGDATTWMWQHSDVRSVAPPRPQLDSQIPWDQYLERRLPYAESAAAVTAYHAAFLLKQAPEALIIGPGGGNEIYVAHQMGASHVTGVELNPVMLDLSLNRYAEFVGHIYQHPKATAVVGEGRSTLRRSMELYDIIQMSGVDTWSGLSSGAYVLSENYLYTVEAFLDFLAHLKPDGLLSVGRWRMEPPRESLRLLSVAGEALRRAGVARPEEHIVCLSLTSPQFMQLLVKKSRFTPEEVQLLADVVERVGSAMYAAPGLSADNPYSRLAAAFAEGREQAFFETYPYDVTPVGDDRPFFFEYYKWSRLWHDLSSPGTGGQIGANRPVALGVLGSLLAQTLLLSGLLMLGPLWVFRRRGLRVPRWGGVLGYFSAVGLAFMFVEVSLMQRFVLFLGHPAYSIPVVLASLLAAAGVGSWLSSRLPLPRRQTLRLALSAVAALLLVSLVVLPGIFTRLLGAELWMRIAVSAGLIALPGVFMGMPFPLGLSLASRSGLEIVPWAWGVNGAASVLGSILVIFAAMGLGFAAATGVAAGLYGLALILAGTLGDPGGGE